MPLVQSRRDRTQRWPEGPGQLRDGGDGGEAARRVRGRHRGGPGARSSAPKRGWRMAS